MSFTVAIDGPAAAGKGTLSRSVAAHFGFDHLDTGLLYRAVAAKVLAGADPVAAAQSLAPSDLAGDLAGEMAGDLRTPAVAQQASRVAANADVRAALVAFQRGFAAQPGGAVLDGRDIGTVICPGAEVKLFVTASPEVRAERRFLELSAKGMELSRAQVLADVKERDARDSGRDHAPLRPAPDAHVIDTSTMTIDEAVAAAIAIIEQKRGIAT